MLFGLLPILIGSAFVAFAVLIAGVSGWALMLLIVPAFFVVIGAASFVYGLWTWWGQTIIELRGDLLRVSNGIGPLVWTGRRAVRGLRLVTVVVSDPQAPQEAKLEVGDLKYTIKFAADATDPPARLVATWSDARQWTLAHDQSRATLEAVAHDLVASCAGVVGPDAVSPRINLESLNPTMVVDRLEQPIGSTAIQHSFPDGVATELPALGLWRGARGLLFVTIVWFLFLVPTTALYLVGAQQFQGDVRIAYVVFPLLWLVGIGLAWGTALAARRSATLRVDGQGLHIRERGVVGTWLRHWSREAVAEVAVKTERYRGPQGERRALKQLMITPRSGPPVHLLRYRDKAELEWIATVLRGALGLASKPTVAQADVLPSSPRPDPVKAPTRLQTYGPWLVGTVVALGALFGWERVEGMTPQGTTEVVRQRVLTLWSNTPKASEYPEAKQYRSLWVRRSYLYGSWRTGSGTGPDPLPSDSPKKARGR